MIVNTKFFGRLEFGENDLLYFKDGLLGLEEINKYVLIDMEHSLKCLQSVDRQGIAFILINPWDIFKDYNIDIDDEEIADFDNKDINNFAVYSILTISEKSITANLIGPLIINVVTHQGKQIVLNNSNYTTKHIIKQFEKR